MSLTLGKITQNVIESIGRRISSPEQRLLQGAVALGVQPFIDFRNKGTDDKTRASSTARIIAKIVAGTLTGVAVRYGAIKLIKNFSRFKLNGVDVSLKDSIAKIQSKLDYKNINTVEKADTKSLFMPSKIDIPKEGLKVEEFLDRYNNYTKIGGTILGTGAMLLTNFLIDVPLTNALTKKLTPVMQAKIEKEKEKEKAQASAA
jgi:hypothetical protein